MPKSLTDLIEDVKTAKKAYRAVSDQKGEVEEAAWRAKQDACQALRTAFQETLGLDIDDLALLVRG